MARRLIVILATVVVVAASFGVVVAFREHPVLAPWLGMGVLVVPLSIVLGVRARRWQPSERMRAEGKRRGRTREEVRRSTALFLMAFALLCWFGALLTYHPSMDDAAVEFGAAAFYLGWLSGAAGIGVAIGARSRRRQ